MIRTDEISKGNGQIEFSLSVAEGISLEPGARPKSAKPAVEQRSASGELSLSVNHVLAGLVSAVFLTSLLVWALVRLWLFEP